MEDKLLIITKLKKTYEYTSKIIVNYPHKYINLKNHIEDTFFEMIELCYLANNGYDVKNNQLICLSKLMMVDYYLKLSYKEEILTKKKFDGIAKHLIEIKAMLNSWVNTNETG